jgi:ribosomal protein S18 acetylase RimI-like enzyme
VCAERDVPPGVKQEPGWRALKLQGPFDLSLVGILASVATPLAEAGVNVFVVATYDTDYVLVKEAKLASAVSALSASGHAVRERSGAVGPSLAIRPAHEEDEPFLWEMLAEAAHEPEIQAVRDNPDVAKYVEGWGRRPHDLGFVAEYAGGEPAGVAWLRLFVAKGAGFGHVDAETPELAVAVRPECRGSGAGTRLLGRLLEEAAGVGYPAVSLSVRADNPAKRLYERVGFREVEGSEVRNRAGGTSVTMKADLPVGGAAVGEAGK